MKEFTPTQMETQTAASPSRSRAQAIRDRVEIRVAVDGAGPAIAEVLKDNGIEIPGVDWSVVGAHWQLWLIATVGNEVVGCCQVLPGRPVGYVEFLFVRPSLSFKLRAIAIRKLIIQSMSTLSHAGSQYVGGVVGHKNFKFSNVLEKLHFVKTFPADMFVKRLA